MGWVRYVMHTGDGWGRLLEKYETDRRTVLKTHRDYLGAMMMARPFAYACSLTVAWRSRKLLSIDSRYQLQKLRDHVAV
jgi:hypothetical protein